MKKVFIFLVLFVNFSFAKEVYFIKKTDKNQRNEILSRGLKAIAETKEGFLILKEKEEISKEEIYLGKFEKNLYFLTPRYEDTNLKICGNILYKEENTYLIEMDTNSPCLSNPNFRIHKISFEELKPFKTFEKIKIGKDPFVEDMLQNFDENLAIEEFINLVSYAESRYSSNIGCFSSVERAYNLFQELGLDPEYQYYSSKYAPNVVAKLEGIREPDKIFILIAHIDDMPKTPPAPGANDNGSGSAMVINLAKILSNYRFAYTIKFLLVTGEEQGLIGSTYYAYNSHQNGEDILGVLNADMIGWEGDGKPTSEDLDLSYDDNSEALAQIFEEVYQLYDGLIPPLLIYCPTNYYSDHYSFWVKGYPAIMGITDNEGICNKKGSYPYYHTHRDTVENCGNLDFFIKTQRTYMAILAHLSKPLCKISKERSHNFNFFDLTNFCPIKIEK